MYFINAVWRWLNISSWNVAVVAIFNCHKWINSCVTLSLVTLFARNKTVTHIKLWYTEWYIKVEFCTCRPITAISPCSRGQRVWGGERGTTPQTTAPNPQETNRYDNSSAALPNYKIRSNLIWTVVGTWGFPSSCSVTNNIMTRASFPSSYLVIHSETMVSLRLLSSCPISQKEIMARSKFLSSFFITQTETVSISRVLSSCLMRQGIVAMPRLLSLATCL